MQSKHKIFLGGTCGQSTWRNDLIPHLDIAYFNPVVEQWTAEAQAKEYLEKDTFCDIHFYLINKEMIGVYSIAEVIDSVHQKDKKTILQIQPEGFEEHLRKSLEAVVDLVNKRGGFAFISQNTLEAALYMNQKFASK